MKIFKNIIKYSVVLILLFILVCFTGCGESNNEEKQEDKYYTVTIVYGNDTENTVLKVKEGDTIETPTQPYKDDYDFIGWYSNNYPYGFSKVVTADITIEARYEIQEDLAEKFTVTFIADGKTYRSIKVYQDRTIDEFEGPKVEGGEFTYWELDGKEFNFYTQIESDLTITAKYQYKVFKVTFNANGTKTEKEVEYGNVVERIADPTVDGKKFYYWKYQGNEYDFTTLVKQDIELIAVFGKKDEDIIHITYDLGYDCFSTKEDLRVAFYTDFYNFLVSKEYDKFEDYEISNVDDFLVFMDTFKWNGRNEMGTIGTAFGLYYVKKDVGGSLENQPESVFLGWCYKNNKYVDFIHHLEVFFEYWRTDEGYSQNDPNGNDFYAEPWASMVDTAKFFYFNGDTLQTRFNGIYKWFDSERVHYALDNIPGVGYVSLVTEEKFAESVVLPTELTRSGYEFTGWVDENGDAVTEVSKSMKVIATWAEVQVTE